MKGTTVSSKYFAFYYHRVMRGDRKKPKKGMIIDPKEILNIQNEIWKTVADHYINNDGGVYIDHIGYLCHIIVPRQSYVASKYFVRRQSTNGYRYKHIGLEIEKERRYYHLIPHPYLVLKCKKEMIKGKRYRFLYNEVVTRVDVLRMWIMKKVSDVSKLKHLGTKKYS